MRRAFVAMLGLAMIGLALAGCPATHGAYPDTKCKIDKDCFIGEMCDQVRETCIAIPPDMGVGDMAFPYDFKTDDLGDAGPTSDDAGDDM